MNSKAIYLLYLSVIKVILIFKDNIVAGHLLYKMFHQNQILIENTYLFQNYLILYEFDIDKDCCFWIRLYSPNNLQFLVSHCYPYK